MGEQHELEQVDGISERRAKWLAAHSFGTLRKLAVASPKLLTKQLEDEGRKNVSDEEIESWVSQARELVAREGRKGEEDGAQEKAPAPAGARGADDWEPVAQFVVALLAPPGAATTGPWQTSVEHMEQEHEVREDWDGFDCERTCAWITGRLSGQLPLDKLLPHAGPADAGPREAAGERGDESRRRPAVATEERHAPTLRLHDAAIVDSAGREGARRLRIDRPCAVRLHWSVENGGDEELAGEWQIVVSLAPMGQGKRLNVHEEPVRVPIEPRADQRYAKTVDVPVDVLATARCDEPYGGLVVLTYATADGGLGAWASCELGPVQFYEPRG